MKEWNKPQLRELGTNMTECNNYQPQCWNWSGCTPPDEETSDS